MITHGRIKSDSGPPGWISDYPDCHPHVVGISLDWTGSIQGGLEVDGVISGKNLASSKNGINWCVLLPFHL